MIEQLSKKTKSSRRWSLLNSKIDFLPTTLIIDEY